MTASSLTRRHRRKESKRRGRRIDAIESTLFGVGAPPNDECKAERAKLCAKLRKLLDEYGEQKPEQLWAYIRNWSKLYEPAEHGLSFVMSLHDDVMALRWLERDEREMARRKAAQKEQE